MKKGKVFSKVHITMLVMALALGAAVLLNMRLSSEKYLGEATYVDNKSSSSAVPTAAKADTDRFMKDAAVIIELLQSLGVDLTRLFSPNVEEDLWKRYYSGDKSAFVRYLSRAIDKNQIRKIGERFAEDAEFRGYVTKYMGTFEGVLSRAQENERADVLTAVLLGSEAGRLYMTLSRVFNKEA